MSASLFVNGESLDVVGDGMSPGTEPSAWARDSRFPKPFGGFGFVTLEGDNISDANVADVGDILSAMYGGQADPDEVSQ